MSLLLLLVDTANKHTIYNNEILDNSLTSVNVRNYDDLSMAEAGTMGSLVSTFNGGPTVFDNNIPQPIIMAGSNVEVKDSDIVIVPDIELKSPTSVFETHKGFSGTQGKKLKDTKPTGTSGVNIIRGTGGTHKYRKD